MERRKLYFIIIVGIIIGIIISIGTSYVLAESLIDSQDVYYKDNSNLLADNVQDAIDGTCIKFENNLTNLKKEIIKEMYPVGSIYISTSLDTKEKVGEALGGTWETYGAGRTLVGTGTSDKEFKINETGGESSHKLTVEEMPSHTHIQDAHRHDIAFDNSEKSFVGLEQDRGNTSNVSAIPSSGWTLIGRAWTLRTVSVVATNQNTGGSKEHNNLQPYTVVYMYKRVK